MIIVITSLYFVIFVASPLYQRSEVQLLLEQSHVFWKGYLVRIIEDKPNILLLAQYQKMDSLE